VACCTQTAASCLICQQMSSSPCAGCCTLIAGYIMFDTQIAGYIMFDTQIAGYIWTHASLATSGHADYWPLC